VIAVVQLLLFLVGTLGGVVVLNDSFAIFAQKSFIFLIYPLRGSYSILKRTIHEDTQGLLYGFCCVCGAYRLWRRGWGQFSARGGNSPGPAAPTVDLSTDQTAVTSGDTFTLTWSSTDATACEASGSWTGSLATSGSSAQQAYGLGERSYSITCSGDGGDSPSSQIVVRFDISPAQQASAVAVSAVFSVL
jgi:hypothetical protein